MAARASYRGLGRACNGVPRCMSTSKPRRRGLLECGLLGLDTPPGSPLSAFGRVGGGRRQTVQTDAELGKFHCHRPGEVEQAAFARIVSDVPRLVLMPGGGNDVIILPLRPWSIISAAMPAAMPPPMFGLVPVINAVLPCNCTMHLPALVAVSYCGGKNAKHLFELKM
jgi:hypothetical protein